MAFLDNSGDIILDAVLTDTGRFRMARGDFRISKFALGDDEIDYSLYNKNHPSGSAYYDLEVLRTPLLEAFTNNTSTMKSKLITITRTNILYLPVMRLMNGGNPNKTLQSPKLSASKINTTTGGYLVTVDKNTEDQLSTDSATDDGILRGRTSERLRSFNQSILIERGLDTTEISPAVNMPATLQETQFIIEMDHRLGSLVSANADQVPVSFIDDDQVASYYISENTVSGQGSPLVITKNTNQAPVVVDSLPTTNAGSVDGDLSIHRINGPRDSILHFKIEPSINLKSSSFLFDKLGGTISGADQAGLKSTDSEGTALSFKIIDTIIKITSATTGVSLDIPIRYTKKA